MTTTATTTGPHDSPTYREADKPAANNGRDAAQAQLPVPSPSPPHQERVGTGKGTVADAAANSTRVNPSTPCSRGQNSNSHAAANVAMTGVTSAESHVDGDVCQGVCGGLGGVQVRHIPYQQYSYY